MAVLAPGFPWQYFDNSGNPLANGKLYTYVTGTTTAKTAYQDRAGAATHANPIVLDSAGRIQPALWIDTDTAYRFTLKTSADVTVDEWDNITGSTTNEVDVSNFGAVGDWTTDDTDAILDAIAAAEALVSDRFKGPGVSIIFPDGTYKITANLEVTSSNIYFVGASPGGAALYAPSSNFDLVHFNGTSQFLYNVGVLNMRFYTPGNATAGCHLRVTKAINCIFDNLVMQGWYDGIISDGCGKTYFSNIILAQENRTASTTCRYGFDFKSTSNNNSDVHVSDFQIIIGDGVSANTLSIRGADGIYFKNGHMFGSVLFQPSSVTCASVSFSQVYFDTSTDTNVYFGGTSSAYRNFFFSGCYFRQSGGYGIEFNASSTVNEVIANGCNFDGHRLFAINAITAVNDLVISGGIFDGNNTDNSANGGDIRLVGKASITGSRFMTGGANGTAVVLTASASDTIIANNSFASSTAGTKISDAGSNNRIRGNTGFVTKNYGQATITNPATTVTVNHGLSVTPSIATISLTYNDASAGVTRVYPSTITSTQFTINSNVTPTTSATIGWLIDTEI